MKDLQMRFSELIPSPLAIKDTPEGQTHYACDVALKEGNGCCGCNHHDCIAAGAEGFMSPPQNTLNVIENAKREAISEIFLCASCRGKNKGILDKFNLI